MSPLGVNGPRLKTPEVEDDIVNLIDVQVGSGDINNGSCKDKKRFFFVTTRRGKAGSVLPFKEI